MKLFKVSFAPIIGTNDANEQVKVGRYIGYVTAANAPRIDAVLREKRPELAIAGYDLEEEVPVERGHYAWSVSVGPVGRSYSMVVCAPSESMARSALETAVADLPYMKRYVEADLFRATCIDLDQENVW